MTRYYYKSKQGNGFLNLKSPLNELEAENYDEITAEQFAALTAGPEPVQPTAAELARQAKLDRISELKSNLARTDYEAIKYAEGWFTDEEYAEYKAQRQAWRVEINQLEQELGE